MADRLHALGVPVIGDGRRLTLAFLLSLLIHGMLLSLTFGGQGLGLPGFGFPWQERRVEAPELRIVLMPAPVDVAQPAVMPVDEPLQQAPIVPPAGLTAGPTPAPDVATGVPPAQAALRTDASMDPVPMAMGEPDVIAVQRSEDTRFRVPAAPAVPAPVVAAAASASSSQPAAPPPRETDDSAQQRIDAQAREQAIEHARLDRLEREAQRQAEQREAARIEAARQEAVRLEAERAERLRLDAERDAAARQAAARQEAQQQEALRQEAVRQETQRVENARLEAERQEAARLAAARDEAARQEATRRESQRIETARQEAARQDAARQEAARQETLRQETARQEAAKQEAARQEAVRQEAIRQEAARQAEARQAAARQEAARVEAAQEQAARREAVLRAIGRQLDEEAARRDAAAAAAASPSRLAPSSSGLRRGRLFGRADANAELVLYAEAWARKIQLNQTFDRVRDAAQRPHTDPLVTVAIRRDGSVESVSFVLSSGVAELDEAIRHVVQSQLPYPAFPPALAREFDVIEIRRTWHFDTAIRLH